ncbi:MAG: hypothetical protein IJ438_02815 [Clostridia bacterium]|nr:hypothetical protein [Clostridia bacterium]
MKRILILLLALCLLPITACAESLLTADTVEEVGQFVLLPEGDQLPAVEAGKVRYISLTNKAGRYFVESAWRNDSYDLTTKTGGYKADCANMHTRAVYCMALSYLGIDVTPVMMSELSSSRDITAPFDGVTARLGNVERVKPKAYVFDTMVENYLNDPSYSPVFVQFRKPNGAMHTVLVVGYIPETGGFIIADPAAPKLDGETLHVYKMAFHVMRQTVLHSAFYDAFYASQVQDVYQWHLIEE